MCVQRTRRGGPQTAPALSGLLLSQVLEPEPGPVGSELASTDT